MLETEEPEPPLFGTVVPLTLTPAAPPCPTTFTLSETFTNEETVPAEETPDALVPPVPTVTL